MKRIIAATVFALAGVLGPATLAAAEDFQMTPAVQAELDRQKTVIAGWAANATIVNAVAEQNRKGPITGLDNAKWKVTRRSDPVVTAFQSNAAGQFLKTKVAETKGAISEAFLSAAQGEKVAFVEKTTSYIHKGAPKFDVPLTTGRAWQGQAEFDESTQTYAIQISVPVLGDGKPVGVLVVGVNLSHLQRLARP
ncbi:MAG TPA: hypothetical protein VGL09_01700 [Methylomirabilota bacterium]|jgi:hypothetical protein